MKSLWQWFSKGSLARNLAGDRRRAMRRSAQGIEAHFWNGGPPAPSEIADISASGLYLRTAERWRPGTLVAMALQKIGIANRRPQDVVSVQSRVVRLGEDGVGCEFVFSPGESATGESPDSGLATGRKAVERFLKRNAQDDAAGAESPDGDEASKEGAGRRPPDKRDSSNGR